MIALDLDGVLCDLGPSVAARIADRFGVATHPSTWRTYDLRLLQLGVPERSLNAFLDEVFDDPALYDQGTRHDGASHGVQPARSRRAGGSWASPPGPPISRRSPGRGWPATASTSTRCTTRRWAPRRPWPAGVGAVAAIEDNPVEADLLGAVCESWLLDRPYNRDHELTRARRLQSWDDAVGRLCQLRLFA